MNGVWTRRRSATKSVARTALDALLLLDAASVERSIALWKREHPDLSDFSDLGSGDEVDDTSDPSPPSCGQRTVSEAIATSPLPWRWHIIRYVLNVISEEDDTQDGADDRQVQRRLLEVLSLFAPSPLALVQRALAYAVTFPLKGAQESRLAPLLIDLVLTLAHPHATRWLPRSLSPHLVVAPSKAIDVCAGYLAQCVWGSQVVAAIDECWPADGLCRLFRTSDSALRTAGCVGSSSASFTQYSAALLIAELAARGHALPLRMMEATLVAGYPVTVPSTSVMWQYFGKRLVQAGMPRERLEIAYDTVELLKHRHDARATADARKTPRVLGMRALSMHLLKRVGRCAKPLAYLPRNIVETVHEFLGPHTLTRYQAIQVELLLEWGASLRYANGGSMSDDSMAD